MSQSDPRGSESRPRRVSQSYGRERKSSRDADRHSYDDRGLRYHDGRRNSRDGDRDFDRNRRSSRDRDGASPRYDDVDRDRRRSDEDDHHRRGKLVLRPNREGIGNREGNSSNNVILRPAASSVSAKRDRPSRSYGRDSRSRPAASRERRGSFDDRDDRRGQNRRSLQRDIRPSRSWSRGRSIDPGRSMSFASQLSRDDSSIPRGFGKKVSNRDNKVSLKTAKNRKRLESQRKMDCKFWMQGKCAKGDECPYKHDASKGYYAPKASGCVFWMNGYCKDGNKCRFEHDPSKRGKHNTCVKNYYEIQARKKREEEQQESESGAKACRSKSIAKIIP